MKKVSIIVIIVAIAGGAGYAWWPVRDEAVHAALIGRWRAEDPQNGALHHRKDKLQSEEVQFTDDGKLSYVIKSEAAPSDPVVMPWGWRVVKGKLRVCDLGEGATGEETASLKISIRGNTLSLQRKNFPKKVFHRVPA